MNTNIIDIKLLGIILILFLLLDGIWLGIIRKNFYLDQFDKINNSPMNIKIFGALIAYLLMGISLLIFVVNSSDSPTSAFLYGALLGLCIYGIYNGTNYATINNYTFETGLYDTMWGTFLFAIVASCVKYYLLFRKK
jgi:uncharacterized membrane protein